MPLSLQVRSNGHFDARAERNYYVRAPQEYKPLPHEVVDTFMTLTTGTRCWAQLLNGKEVLELGAGECVLLEGLLERARPGSYVASDLFAYRMGPAQSALEHRRVEFIKLNLLDTQLPDASFDVILAFGLFHHIPNLGEAFGECRRILRPGGKLIFRDPWAGNPLLWFLYRFVFTNSANEAPLFLQRTCALLRASGFRIDHVSRFWLRFPWAPRGPWSTNLGVVATREDL